MFAVWAAPVLLVQGMASHGSPDSTAFVSLPVLVFLSLSALGLVHASKQEFDAACGPEPSGLPGPSVPLAALLLALSVASAGTVLCVFL